MDDEDRGYASRNFDPEAHNRYVATLLHQLEEAERKTDPALGATSEANKDREAFLALRTAGELVRAVAGWALDHVYGLSMLEAELLPLQPLKTRGSEAYLSNRAQADKHSLERDGGHAFEEGSDLSPLQKRAMLRNLIFADAGGLPRWLRDESFRALDALSHGETLPILAATKTKQTALYRELHAQLRAVSFVRFLHASKETTLEEGRARVANAYGVSGDTVKSWERRLPNEDAVGKIEFDRTVEFAKNAASYVAHVRIKKNKGFLVSDDDMSMRDHHLEAFGHKALMVAAAEYKNIRQPDLGAGTGFPRTQN